MQQSYGEEIDAKCPECGTAFKKFAWLVINTEERPDLAQEISNGSLDLIVCTSCNKPVGYLDTPLLLYQPAEKCPLYFFPPRSLPPEKSNEMCYRLIELFCQLAGSGVRAVIDELGVVSLPREMLPHIFKDEAKKVLAQTIEVERQTIVQSSTESMSAKAADLDQRLGKHSRLQELLGQLVAAETRNKALFLLNYNPELLSDEALTQLALWSTRSDDASAKSHLQSYYHLIFRCREIGISQALLESTELFPEEKIIESFEEYAPEFQEAVSRLEGRGLQVKIVSSKESQAEDEAEASGDAELPSKLKGLIEKAFNYTTLLEWDRALKTYDLAVSAWQQVIDNAALPRDALWVVIAWNQLSVIYTHLCREFGQKDKSHDAVAACEEALKIANEGTPEWAMSKANSALAYRIRYDTLGGIEDLDSSLRAFEMAIAATPEDGPDWDTMHGNYGLALIRRFEFSGEVSDLNRAISAIRKSFKKAHEVSPGWGARQTYLGMALARRFEILKRREDIDEGIEAFRKALAATLEQHHDWSRANHNLGYGLFTRYEQFGDVADLKDSLKAEQTALSSAPKGSPSWTMAMAHLGIGYVRLFQQELHAKHLEKGIDHLRQALGETPADSPDRSAWTASLGTAHYERFLLNHKENDYEAATRAYEEVIAVLWPDQQIGQLVLTARSLGALYAIRSRWNESVEAFNKAVSSIANLYRVQLLLEGREAWLARVTDLYRLAAYSFARAERLEEAVTIMEQGRARGLSTSLARDRANLQELQALDPQTYQQYINAAMRLRQLEVAERTTGTHGTGPDLEAFNEEARHAREELETALKRIRQLPNYADFLAEPDFDDVVRAVTPETPLVYVITTGLGSIFLLVHKAGNSRASVEAIRAYKFTTSALEELAMEPGEDEPAQDQALAKSLPVLGEGLMANLARRLRQLDVKSVVLIPCGELGLFPLHDGQYHDGERTIHFLDEFDVTFAPCARALHAAQRELKLRDPLPQTLAGVANPLPHPRPLNFAHLELRSLASIFNTDSCFTFYGEAATKEAVLSATPGVKYVHFACHGMFDAEDPLNSSVELTNQDALSLRQILYVNSEAFAKARLVTLSTCQSAIPEFRRIADEVINLPTGFLQAGVPGVVGSLWPVNDISTALLMVKFYEYMLLGNRETGEKPVSPSRALGQAQRWLRGITAGELAILFRAERQKATADQHMAYEIISSAWRRFVSMKPSTITPFSDPVYWGAFTFTGV